MTTTSDVIGDYRDRGIHYAMVKDGVVINYIVMPEEDEEFLQHLVEVHGADHSVFCEDTLIPTVDYGVGSLYIDGKLTPPKPYDSWAWNSEEDKWTAPTSQPTGDFVWDESLLSWVPYARPYPSFTWDGTHWQAPVEPPKDSNGDSLPYNWDEESSSWVEKPQPYPSWTWVSSIGAWVAPTLQTKEMYLANPGKVPSWNESTLSWDFIDPTE